MSRWKYSSFLKLIGENLLFGLLVPQASIFSVFNFSMSETNEKYPNEIVWCWGLLFLLTHNSCQIYHWLLHFCLCKFQTYISFFIGKAPNLVTLFLRLYYLKLLLPLKVTIDSSTESWSVPLWYKLNILLSICIIGRITGTWIPYIKPVW